MQYGEIHAYQLDVPIKKTQNSFLSLYKTNNGMKMEDKRYKETENSMD